MVLAFRITELQVLLGSVGKQKTGKKQELMDRALMLLRNPSFHLTSKIRELHSQRTHRSNGTVLHRPSSTLQSYHHKPPEPPHLSHYNGGSGGSTKFLEDENLTMNVTLITLPFYDHISQILPPTLLAQNSFNNRYQEVMVAFSLSPQHAREITTNRNIGQGGVYTSDVQVQLRFAPTDNEHVDIKDMYPPCLVLRLNGKMIQLPNPIPTNKQNADPKRPPRPLDLTWSCRLTPMVQNSLLISWALPNEPELPKNYCYTINLVRKRSSEYLTKTVMARGVRPRRATETLIKSKLSNEEDDIALTSLKVSLLCPLGKMRMTLPCCPSTCDHIQCFDARLYLMMNEKKPTWNCPVCDSPAKFDDLVVDELFSEICQIAGDCDEILFSPDGSWAPLGPPGKDAQPVHAKQNGSAQPQSPNRNGIKPVSLSPQKEEKSTKEADIDIIVLSDSDDDDDEGVSDGGSSIQPVRHNKRPISAISSDSSSLDLNSASSSINGPTSRPPDNRQMISNPAPLYNNPSSQSLFNVPGSSLGTGMPSYSGFLDTMNSASLPTTSAHSFATPSYPLLMPSMPSMTSSFLDYPTTSTYGSRMNLFSMAPQDLSNRPCGMRIPIQQNISEPTLIDFSPNGYDDSPLLDDSDIIPLD